jgi:polyhydroxyalkanoate synthesis repressor PhaR
MTTTTSKQPKVIKRYANRKLYDTERSCYVTLEEIAQMIKEGDDVKVVDNKTKDDLTAVTLAQIIVEEEKKVQKMPLKLLRSIIQSGPDLPDWKGALGELYTERVADPVKRIRDDVERRVESLIKRDGDKVAGKDAAKDATATAPAAPAPIDPRHEEMKAGVVKEFVHSTTEAFESWQKRIDERVREAMSKMSPGPRPDVDALKARIEALEARIREVESRKKA